MTKDALSACRVTHFSPTGATCTSTTDMYTRKKRSTPVITTDVPWYLDKSRLWRSTFQPCMRRKSPSSVKNVTVLSASAEISMYTFELCTRSSVLSVVTSVMWRSVPLQI
uniref:Uncharacterized protein n=1 Tax=Timspurckia oligopyrenoides TaxID=708627 RepID=A0A7S0ZG03_9RHOD|mmetsp:Transcript_3743/g.6538  ORF Transcript_3743/g.6538 Transcript_3743/m.6538 type:complete len:110 (+) Transcript_3743:113-442(+)